MKTLITRGALMLALTIFSATATATAWADDVKGSIERIDPAELSFTVQGIVFLTTPATDYDDGLERFEDLRVGQRVEVDFEYRGGRHVATEIELDD